MAPPIEHGEPAEAASQEFGRDPLDGGRPIRIVVGQGAADRCPGENGVERRAERISDPVQPRVQVRAPLEHHRQQPPHGVEDEAHADDPEERSSERSLEHDRQGTFGRCVFVGRLRSGDRHGQHAHDRVDEPLGPPSESRDRLDPWMALDNLLDLVECRVVGHLAYLHGSKPSHLTSSSAPRRC